MAPVGTVEGAQPHGQSEVQPAVQASGRPRGRGRREADQPDLPRALALAPHGVCDSAGTPLSDSIVRRWVEQYRERGADAFRTGDPKAEELAAVKKRIAELLKADYLPAVWLPDDETLSLRELTSYRTGLVQERTQVKNRIHSILHWNLIPRPDVKDLFGKTGRHYLSSLSLRPGEQFQLDEALAHLDFLEARIARADEEIAKQAVRPEWAEAMRLLCGAPQTVDSDGTSD